MGKNKKEVPVILQFLPFIPEYAQMPFPTACKGELHRSRGTHTLLFFFFRKECFLFIGRWCGICLAAGCIFVLPDVGR